MYKHTGELDTLKYTVSSYGHGAAYVFTRKSDGYTLWAEGGDAIEMHGEAEERGWPAVLDEYAEQFTHGG